MIIKALQIIIVNDLIIDVKSFHEMKLLVWY